MAVGAHDDLQATVLARRDDVTAWSVAADLLEARGDKRAQLMAMMLTREVTASRALAEQERAFLEEHASWLLGPALRDRTFSLTGEPQPVHRLTWRRGHLFDVSLSTATALTELVGHASAQLLERLRIDLRSAPRGNEPALEPLRSPLPCRSLRVSVPGLGVQALTELIRGSPALVSLTIEYPEAPLRLPPCPSLEELVVHPASAGLFEGLERTVVPKLSSLVALGADDPVGLVAMLAKQSWWRELQTFHLTIEDQVAQGISLRDLIAQLQGPRPARVILGLEEPITLTDPGVTSYAAQRVETAFLVTARFGAEERRLFTNLAQMAGAKRLAMQVVQARPLALTAVRFLGEPGATLGPRAFAEVLMRRGMKRVACFFVSESNNTARAWTPDGQLEDSHHFAGALIRRVVDAQHGADPGTVFEDVPRWLIEAPPELLAGEDDRGLVVITELEAVPVPDYDDDEDLSEDALDPHSEDAEPVPHEDDSGEWDMYGDLPLATVDTPAVVEAPDDEDDEPFQDLVDAGVAEVIAEGPVDWDEEWNDAAAPAAEVPVDPDTVASDQIDTFAGGAMTIDGVCVVCRKPSDVEPCARCHQPVCLECSRTRDGEDRDERTCFECEPTPGAGGPPS